MSISKAITSFESLLSVDNNNKGVDKLDEGDFQRAIQFFCTALTSLKFEEEEAASSSTDHDQSQSDDMCTTRTHNDETFKQLGLITFYEETLFDSCSPEDLVYRRGIRFIPGHRCSSSGVLTALQRSILSSIVILNLALVFHLTSIASNNPRERKRLLDKSNNLYSKSLGLAGHASSQAQKEANNENKILAEWLSMVICNNIAQICYELNDQDQAGRYLQEIIRRSHHSKNKELLINPSDRWLSVLLDKWRDIFLLNVIYMNAAVAPLIARAA
jgi:tetratricopeptide (TPR) repeat protein